MARRKTRGGTKGVPSSNALDSVLVEFWWTIGCCVRLESIIATAVCCCFCVRSTGF